MIAIALSTVVVYLSVAPVLNLASGRQLMNYSYDPLDLVNTYGAFGTVGRERDEIILKAPKIQSLLATRSGRNTNSKPSRVIQTGGRRSSRPINRGLTANLVRCDGFTWRIPLDIAFCLETSA